MKKIIFILSLIVSIAHAQSDTTKYNKSPNYGDNFRRIKTGNFLLPTDTTNFKHGFAGIGTTAYIGNGSKWTAISGGSTPVTNGLVQVDSIRATDTLEVTIYATDSTPAIWRISGVEYSFDRDSVFTITAATTGYFRKDIIVGNASGSYQLIQGVEATTTAVQPATPANTVLITVVDVTGSSVVPPAPDLSGFAQLNSDNTYTGLNDFYGETNFRWITNFYSSAFRFKNQSNSNTSTITWPTDANYIWAYPNVTGRLASIRDTSSLLASRFRLDSFINAGTTNIGNSNLRLTGNRSLSGGAGASNGYSFTFDSTASINGTRKSDGLDYFYVGQDGEFIIKNILNESFKVDSYGGVLMQSANNAEDDMPTRVTLSAQEDTATFTFSSTTKIKAEKVNPNNGSSYKLVALNDATKEFETVASVNVDTTNRTTGIRSNARAIGDSTVLAAAINAKPNFGDVRDEIADTLNAFNRLRAGTSAGGVFQTNTGATSFSYGAGGSTEVTFNGFLGYNTNRSSSYTDRSATDKRYVDSSAALKVNIADTSVFARKAIRINNQTASYTLVLGDAGTRVRVSNASANTLTVPPNSSVAFPIGTQIIIKQVGNGQTTITAGSGVTFVGADGAIRLRVLGSLATLTYIGGDVWDLEGDLI